MREILFRAKRLDNNEWVYGNLFIPISLTDNYKISDRFDAEGDIVDVAEATVGQFVGKCDDDGIKLFEHDIVNVRRICHDSDGSEYYSFRVCEVLFYNSQFVLRDVSKPDFTGYMPICSDANSTIVEMTVIGNSFDNPEYLDEI